VKAQKYISGKKLCQGVAVKQNGAWVTVPNNYKKSKLETSPLYYRFLGGKYDVTKPTVVYVDGGPGATSHNYHKLYDDLAKEFNILFFDQRGFVCSRPDSKAIQDDPNFYSVENSARDIEEIRKELGIERIIILGHSFGATIGLKYAELFPEKVKKVTLIGPAFITPENQKEKDEFIKNLRVKTDSFITHELHTCDSLKLVHDLSYDFANSLGIEGLEKLVEKVQSDLLKDKSLMEVKEGYEFLSSLFEGNLGKFALRDETYTWETQGDTEFVMQNDFKCSFLFDQHKEYCKVGEVGDQNTFDIKKMKVSVPVDIFLGEFDGTEKELKRIDSYIKSGNTYYLKERGHGAFTEFYDNNSFEKAKLSSEVLTRSLLNKRIPVNLREKLWIKKL
tara:strand:+ start:178 stop:1350 length:1173 start_codon:yes stop_codon:yes gene_type:complete